MKSSNPSDMKLFRELVELNEVLSTQVGSLIFLVSALLCSTDKRTLRHIKAILEAQSASDEFQGPLSESLPGALEIVSLFCDSDGPVDPRKLFRLIQGGKKE